MQQQAYPYCIHGMYVGGCGIDFMCGACEMGDEAPSVEDIKENMRHSYTQLSVMTNIVASAALGGQT